jgi:hypothetical protein
MLSTLLFQAMNFLVCDAHPSHNRNGGSFI